MSTNTELQDQDWFAMHGTFGHRQTARELAERLGAIIQNAVALVRDDMEITQLSLMTEALQDGFYLKHQEQIEAAELDNDEFNQWLHEEAPVLREIDAEWRASRKAA